MGKVIAGNRISFQIIKTKPTMSSSYTLQIPIKTLSYYQCVIDYNDDELRSSNNKSAASPYWKQGIPLKLSARACVCVCENVYRDFFKTSRIHFVTNNPICPTKYRQLLQMKISYSSYQLWNFITSSDIEPLAAQMF